MIYIKCRNGDICYFSNIGKEILESISLLSKGKIHVFPINFTKMSQIPLYLSRVEVEVFVINPRLP